jgi:hypothetical protein
MNFRVVACALVGASLVSGSAFAVKKPENPEYLAIKKEFAQLKKAEAPPATATTGDADSFGRNVKFIGLIASGAISLQSDCTPDPSFPPGPEDHCFVTNPAPAVTTFTVNDAARMIIPAKSSNSLFCHWQTPIAVYSFENPTAVYQHNARIIVTPSYVVQNAVLNDPSMIDPTTGLPFNGQLTVSLAGIRHSRGLQPGDAQIDRDAETRVCIAGMISKQALIDGYGLTPTQATNFFKNDTTITMNISGSAALVGFASIIYSTRFVGD